MQRVPFNIGGVSFCEWHACRGCDLQGNFRERASADWLQSFKLNAFAMGELRAMALAERLGEDLSRLNDDEIIARVRAFIERRGLRKCGKPVAALAARGNANQTGSEAVIRVLEVGDKVYPMAGAVYRLVRAEQWRKLRDDGGYQVVPTPEASQIIEQLAANPAASPPEKAAWGKAAQFLPQQSGRFESGLLLLRIVPRRNFRSPAAEAAITPSQLARMVQEKHWVAIELVDEDGNGVEGVAYLIVTPDGQENRGYTDANGLARIDNIPAGGQCKISFPELDKDAYKAA